MKNLLQYIQEFPEQLEQALKIAQESDFKPFEGQFKNIVVCGLGGSAFGAELVRNYVISDCILPFYIIRSYEVPAFINSDTLVIACSYSGSTEETLSCFQACLKKHAKIISITSGGILAQIAEEHNIPCFVLPKGYPPRMAFAYSFVLQLEILMQHKLIFDFRHSLKDAILTLRNFDDRDLQLAQQVAQDLYNKIPVIYSSDKIEAISIRLRQQINENAKQLCWHHIVPEMNHNELVGWEQPLALLPRIAVIELCFPTDHQQVKRRMEIAKPIFENSGAKVLTITPKGGTPLAQMLYLIHISDYISLYLAELNQVDPIPVKVIDYFKQELAK